MMTTFFREGKFQHKCSICKEFLFTCPVIHPDTARLWKTSFHKVQPPP